ncbi:MAG: hypoxanthine phosphoribosyltransferase [Clostridia bacterium]|nr:hypoxanthine phosphoribosyltransferase [Clostridia bacterium]
MVEDLKNVLISEEKIKEIVKKLGKEITEDYKGKNLILISVLKGSVVFMADLMREIDLPLKIDFMIVSSYGDKAVSSGKVKIVKDLDIDLSDLDVLMVEDILDTGRTLCSLLEILRTRNPKSLKLCTFLDKPDRRATDIEADYVGAKIPDEFVVGYGLDFNQRYRNLPYVGVLKPEVYE